jgi:CRP/FNR family transcriptional regulator, cyclic AMP receptor protein
MTIPRTKTSAAKISDRQTFNPGDLIFREGSTGNCAYFIETGRIEVSKLADGAEQTIGTLGKGSLLGEMALIDDAPRMATARAIEPTTLLRVDRSRLKKKIDAADPFIGSLLRILTQNVRSITDRHIAAVGQLDRIKRTF